MKILTILCTILIVSSCAFHSGTITSNVTDEPVIHKDVAIGVASTNIVLSIGGLSKDALISEARKNMIRARPLEGNEQYNNIEVNIKNTYYIFGRKTNVTVIADVIAPKDSANQASYSENYMEKINKAEPLTSMFSIGDSVILNNYNYQIARIASFSSNESQKRVVLGYLDEDGEFQKKEVSTNRIFLITPEYFGLKLGQRFGEGVIVGFGLNQVMIKAAYGNTTVRYPR